MPLAAYLWTCAIEVPIVVGVLWRLGWVSPAGLSRVVLTGWVVQLTQPILWWLAPRDWTGLLAAEIAVWLLEGGAVWLLLHRRVPHGRLADACAATIVANAASFAFGLVWWPLIGG